MYLPLLIFIVFIVLLLFSIDFRLEGKVTASNIICIIMIVLLLGGPYCNDLLKKSVESNKSQFEEYVIEEHLVNRESAFYSDERRYRVKDIDSFIEQIRNNNESGKKVSLVFEEHSYTSNDELDELLDEIKNKMGKRQVLLVGKKTYDVLGYVDTISIFIDTRHIINVESFNASITTYAGNQTGSQVRGMLERLKTNADKYTESDDVEIVEVECIGDSIDGIDVVYRDDNDNSIQEYQNALDEISDAIELRHTYWVGTSINNKEGYVDKVTIYNSRDDLN